jgi:hypothetical protein
VLLEEGRGAGWPGGISPLSLSNEYVRMRQDCAGYHERATGPLPEGISKSGLPGLMMGLHVLHRSEFRGPMSQGL